MEDLICLCDRCHELHHFGRAEKPAVEKPKPKFTSQPKADPAKKAARRERKLRRRMRKAIETLSRNSGYSVKFISGLPARELDSLKLKYAKPVAPITTSAERTPPAEPTVRSVAQRQCSTPWKRVIAITDEQVAAELPNEESITLTLELIERCRTNGSFTGPVLKLLCGTSMPTSGWRDRLVGKVVTRDLYKILLKSRWVYGHQRLFDVTNLAQ